MKQNTPMALIKPYLPAHKKSLVLLALFFICSMALQLLAPQLLGGFIDAAIGNAGAQVLYAILFYFVTILLSCGATALVDYRSQALGCAITDACRRDVLRHYLRIPMEKHNGIPSGEAMTRLDEDPQGLFQYVYVTFFKLGASALLLAGVLVVLFLQDGLLACLMLLVSMGSILLFKWIQDRGVAKYMRSAAATAAFNGTMKELVDSAVELRSLNATTYGTNTLKDAMCKRYKENFPASLMYGNLWSASTMMEAAVQICALGVGVFLWDGGYLTAGSVFAIYSYTTLVISPLQDFRNHMGQLQEARAGILRMQELFAMPADPAGNRLLNATGGTSLEIRGLSFSYTPEKEVLHNINFTVKPGEHVALMGETG